MTLSEAPAVTSSGLILSNILSDRDIVKARNAGKILIEPFATNNLTSVAYDVTLGKGAYCVSSNRNYDTIDLSKKEEITNSWKLITPQHRWYSELGIVINPGETVIAHTHEFIGARKGAPITTMLRARSTIARAGVSISSSAGWGDCGFADRWALMIHNHRPDRNVFIPFGMRVAQIIFFALSSISSKDYISASGSYASIGSKAAVATSPPRFEDLENKWRPTSLLPTSSKACSVCTGEEVPKFRKIGEIFIPYENMYIECPACS